MATQAKEHAKNHFDRMELEDPEQEDENENAKAEREARLKEKFDRFWNAFLRGIQVPTSNNNYQFRTDQALACLYDRVDKRDRQALEDELKKWEFEERMNKNKNTTKAEAEKLVKSFQEKHFSVISTSQWFKGFFNPDPTKHILRAKSNVVKRWSSVVSYLDQCNNSSREFRADMLHDIFTVCNLYDNLKDSNEQIEIKFTKEFHMKFTVKVFVYALQVFDEMQDKYEDETSIKRRVQEKKEDYWSMYHQVFKKEGDEICLGNMFVKTLGKPSTEK